MARRNQTLAALDYADAFAERMIATGLVPWGSLETYILSEQDYFDMLAFPGLIALYVLPEGL